MINTSKIHLAPYLNVAYFIKLFSLFILFYYFNISYLAITDPQHYYNYFLDHYFNYIYWLRTSILYGAQLITYLFGQQTYINPPHTIETAAGTSVILSFSCLGLGILSFWSAFVIANNGTWQKKICWCLGGLVFIWFINCWRIGLLLLAMEKQWKSLRTIDHHDLFNIVTYTSVLLLMYYYSREKEDELVVDV
ncbi:hypothetical protein [Spirosoma sp. KNUC1025]|uniref:hypothetical protein n=1 Tax=Spirosoma sp. KNUC1025 TaxID=2894082 RepID=UPI00386BAD39|nr:hypothetical protein LN737_23870 [Spirosoma sp. KNUC1025]